MNRYTNIQICPPSDRRVFLCRLVPTISRVSQAIRKLWLRLSWTFHNTDNTLTFTGRVCPRPTTVLQCKQSASDFSALLFTCFSTCQPPPVVSSSGSCCSRSCGFVGDPTVDLIKRSPNRRRAVFWQMNYLRCRSPLLFNFLSECGINPRLR